MMSLDIYKEIIRIIESGSSAALSTLVTSRGSVPRHEGTKMIIYPDGRIMGTIGGGSWKMK